MKLYAQHGFGPKDKILNGLSEGTIDGVIFSTKYAGPDKIPTLISKIQEQAVSADILVDPEFYAVFYAGHEQAKLGYLEDWPYFSVPKRSELETDKMVNHILRNAFKAISKLEVSAIIAPNIFISKSFDSIEAVIAKNFLRRTQPVFKRTGDTRPVYATLAIGRDALLNPSEFKAFLHDITALSDPPDGFYLLIGSGPTGERAELTRSEIIHADVVAGWMLLNHTLSLNGFQVINGCSDILTPFLGAAGGQAGATGWWTNLRSFSMNRYISSGSGGRLPIVKYLSNVLLDRIRHTSRNAYAKLLPEVNNGLPHDTDYEKGEPDRNVEALQAWEAISRLNDNLIDPNIGTSLKMLSSAVKKTRSTYDELASAGLSEGVEASYEYTQALQQALKSFKEIAEL